MKYEPQALNYTFDSLEPYVDERTMEIHYTKHYQAYINNLNDVLAKYPQLSDKKLEDMLENFESIEMNETDKKFFRNNSGGYLNHNIYWNNMSPKNLVDEILVSEIISEFGSVEEFKKLLSDVSLKHFGSGWGWLVKDKKGKLKVYSLANQDSPYLLGDIPIIALDVWEHAYYLKYQNRRIEYIQSWWNTVKIIK